MHKAVSAEKDMGTIVCELTKAKILDSTAAGRSHSTFRKPRQPLRAKSEDFLLNRMEKHIHFE